MLISCSVATAILLDDESTKDKKRGDEPTDANRGGEFRERQGM